MEYGSTPFIWMAPIKMAAVLTVYKMVRLKVCLSHTCHSRVFASVTRLLALLESTAVAPHRQVAKRANCVFLLIIIVSSAKATTILQLQ